MIIIIDICIILIITVLSISNSFNKNLIQELLKLGSLLAAIGLTNITSINIKLNEILINQMQMIFNIEKSFNIEVFNAISFLLVFLIFYFIILSLSRISKNYIKDFSKAQSDFLHKILIVFLSTIRMVLITTLLIYSLESSIFYSKSIQKKVHTSPSLKAFSSFSNSIIRK